MKIPGKTLLPLILAIVIAPSTYGDIFVGYTSRAAFAGTDFVDWGQLGPNGLFVPDPVNATSTGGIGVTVHQPSGQWARIDQGGGAWPGNFAFGDNLLWDYFESAPWTMTFSQQIEGLGFQTQSDFFGPFTALLEVFDASNTLIGSFSENGNGSSAGDNSAIFIGIKDITAANIKFAKISVTNSSSFGFAINRMDLAGGAPALVPEPVSILLLGTVLAVIGRRSIMVLTTRSSWTKPSAIDPK